MQTYQNHRRLYPLHHFVVTPLTILYLAWSLMDTGSAISAGEGVQESIFHVVGASIIAILPLLARIYGLKNQNRIIRLEMRQRYFELTGTSFWEKEKQLRLSQVIALRFAGNVEILPLIDRAIVENLSADEIKKSIKDWQEDRHRV